MVANTSGPYRLIVWKMNSWPTAERGRGIMKMKEGEKLKGVRLTKG